MSRTSLTSLAFTIVSVLLILPLLTLASAGCAGHPKSGDVASAGDGELVSGNPYPRYCPVMGGGLEAESLTDPALYSDHDGKRYHFCCEGCKPEFEKAPAKWIAEPAKPKKDKHTGHAH